MVWTYLWPNHRSCLCRNSFTSGRISARASELREKLTHSLSTRCGESSSGLIGFGLLVDLATVQVDGVDAVGESRRVSRARPVVVQRLVNQVWRYAAAVQYQILSGKRLWFRFIGVE